MAYALNIQAIYDGAMTDARARMKSLVTEKERLERQITELQATIDASIDEGAKYGLKESPPNGEVLCLD